jgi:hypothetical protein
VEDLPPRHLLGLFLRLTPRTHLAASSFLLFPFAFSPPAERAEERLRRGAPAPVAHPSPLYSLPLARSTRLGFLVPFPAPPPRGAVVSVRKTSGSRRR